MKGSDEDEAAIRAVLDRIDAAWRSKEFDALEECFDENATIVGPGYAVFASGGKACADSYREFASNASVIDYAESDHQLRVWGATAIQTFTWRMTYRREGGPKSESGTDQRVLARDVDAWRVVFRYIHFASQG